MRTLVVLAAMAALAAYAPAQIQLGALLADKGQEVIEGGKVVESKPIPGAFVEEVRASSLAEGLKLQKGDIIRGIVSAEHGKQRVDELDHVKWVMKNSTKPPSEVYYLRGGQLYCAKPERVVKEVIIKTYEVRPGGENYEIKKKVEVWDSKTTKAKSSDLENFKPVDPKK